MKDWDMEELRYVHDVAYCTLSYYYLILSVVCVFHAQN